MRLFKKTKSSQDESNVVIGPNTETKKLFTIRNASIVVALAVVGGITANLVSANQTTATPKGIWMSIEDVKKLPMTGPAWNNLKSVADGSLGAANISDQTSNHDTNTLAVALVYARTGDEAYRKKAADAVMSAVGTEKGGRTLALAWNLTAYVVAADLINLPQYNQSQNTTFVNWLRGVRTTTLDGKTLISTHEERPNNWGTGAGSSRVAADIYLNDRADLEKAANVFKGWLGDRSAYASFSYGDLSFQCDPAKPVGINPAGCKKGSVSVDGAIPDDMRRGDSFKEKPVPTHYPWTALEGAVPQAFMLSRQGYDTFGWSNQALKRSMQYLYDLSKTVNGEWWHDEAAAKPVPWLINSAYGSNYPASTNANWGRVMNFTDWTHAKPTSTQPETPKDTQPPTNPSNLKANTALPKSVSLSWGPSTDNVAVAGYEVSRNGTVIASTQETSYTDTSAAANQTYTYAVKSYDSAGNKSGSVQISIKVGNTPADTQAPTVSLTSPKNNATITTASAALTATAQDNVGIAKVEFYVNTQLEATAEGIAGKTSYSVNWNAKAAGNGSYTIEARAYDAAGNAKTSTSVVVTVAVKTEIPPTDPGGGTVSFVAIADSRVSQKSPNKNYGTENFLRIRDYKSEDWTTYFAFNVTGMSKAPKKVTLRVFATDGGPSAGKLFRVGAWQEKSITWNNKPLISPWFWIADAKPASVNDRSWAEFNITSTVTGNGTYYFALQGSDDNSVYFDSREGKNKPTLVVVK